MFNTELSPSPKNKNKKLNKKIFWVPDFCWPKQTTRCAWGCCVCVWGGGVGMNI